MPNINRPSLKHTTNFKTKDGDRWLPFEDDAQINQMIEAFMVINSKVIWDKTILKSCNRAFCNLPGGKDFRRRVEGPGHLCQLQSQSRPFPRWDHFQKRHRDLVVDVQES